MAFVEPDAIQGLPPINGAIAEMIPDLAGRFVKAIRGPKRRLDRVTFEPWLQISIENAAGLNSKEDLDNAVIEAESPKALALFGSISRLIHVRGTAPGNR